MSDLLLECAKKFERLTDDQYHIIAGRSKGSIQEKIEMTITFHAAEFYHLAGLHKLSDLPQFRRVNRSKVIAMIAEGALTEAQARKSAHFGAIEDRLELMGMIESFIDSNELVFRYQSKYTGGTMIEADYLMQNKIAARTAYLFLAQRKENETMVCRSFFYKKQKDYAKGQQKFKLLYKAKTDQRTGETVVQYDRLIRES